MNPMRAIVRLARYRLALFVATSLSWSTFHAVPLAYGLLIAGVFDRLADGAPARSIWGLVAGLAALMVGRLAVFESGFFAWATLWHQLELIIRRNVLGWLMTAPGSRALPVSPGAAVSTFRDDANELVRYAENWIDFGGVGSFMIVAYSILFSVDASIALALLGPLLATVIFTRSMTPTIRNLRRARRLATERVTMFVGETFTAVQAVKVAGKEPTVIERFEQLNETRRKAALRDSLLTELLRSVNVNMANVAIGIVLLMTATDLPSGDLSVGDLTLFLLFLPRMTSWMAFLGDMIAQHRRAGVSLGRLTDLTVDGEAEDVLDRAPLSLRGALPEVKSHDGSSVEALRRLTVEGLTYRFDETAGIRDVAFVVDAGEFVVITGRIGSGKTTVVRSLLGLVPADGTVRWNDVAVTDPATFFVPPRSAYTAQVPRLFSETLQQNITLGQTVAIHELDDAIDLAVMRPDLASLERGMMTLVGTRGVKLSGGQVQRSAAARMFVTDAELLVFDDLSSALDVRTEQLLWENLFATRRSTCLVVSHRRAALTRADKIIVMHEGSVAATGTLAELLETSEAFRELWNEA